MRWLILITVLIAFAVSAVGYNLDEYEIFIYGTQDGFRVVYRWIEPGYGDNNLYDAMGNEVYHFETATFYVESMGDIKPTPAEMEAD